MLRPRIIPCLLIHKGGLVKTVNFKSPKYIGDPINAVKIFNEKEVDELIVLDIDASVNNSEPNYRLISHLANECRMPICYGGGIKTAVQASKIISLGVEKIAISSAAIENPELITEIAKEIGRQSVVVVLDVKRRLFKRGYDVWIRNAKYNTKRCVIEFSKQLEQLGAGEVVFNSIDLDGKMGGYDLLLAAQAKQTLGVPVTILGGAGCLDDIEALLNRCGVVGVAAGSLFVFKGPYRAVLINYPSMSKRDDLISKVFCD